MQNQIGGAENAQLVIGLLACNIVCSHYRKWPILIRKALQIFNL